MRSGLRQRRHGGDAVELRSHHRWQMARTESLFWKLKMNVVDELRNHRLLSRERIDNEGLEALVVADNRRADLGVVILGI